MKSIVFTFMSPFNRAVRRAPGGAGRQKISQREKKKADQPNQAAGEERGGAKGGALAEETKQGFGSGAWWRFDFLAHVLAGENNGRTQILSNLCKARLGWVRLP